MPSEIDLLRTLDDQPRTPSTVDVERAITAGRRRQARRTAGYAGAAGVTVLALTGATLASGLVSGDATPRGGASGPPAAGATTGATSPAVPASCTLQRLPVPEGEPMALVTGADPTGRYLVGRTYPRAGGYQAVIWHGTTVEKVMLPGDIEESLTDVNSTGTAVGWSYSAAGQAPYVYRNGEVAQLPGVAHGSATAINEAGAIAGVDDDSGTVVVWPSPTAEPRRLPHPAGAGPATHAAIDEDGTVVGTLSGKAYAWFPDGSHRLLPLPRLDGEPAVTAAVHGVRDGWANGTATNGAGRRGEAVKPGDLVAVAVWWHLRTGAVKIVEGVKTTGDAANASGWQAGTDARGRAVLVADGRTVPLPGLTDRRPDGLSTLPTTLSDDGRVIGGQSDDASGTTQAVVWHCG